MPQKKNGRFVRHLRPEEERLWRVATELVSPLKAELKQTSLLTRNDVHQDLTKESSLELRDKPNLFVDWSYRGQTKKSKKGKVGRPHIDARLDLHGLNQTEAYDFLKAAIAEESAKGSSVLLVITGKGLKGSSSIEGMGVLRKQVPLWVSSFPEIAKLEPAHRYDGGEGALYVHIRKQTKRPK